MRTCKEWMGLPRPNLGRAHAELSLLTKQIIKKEIRNAPNLAVLNRRYAIMNTNLRLMFEHEDISGPLYSRLKIILRVEYENRWNVLRKED